AMRFAGEMADEDAVDHVRVVEDAHEETRILVRQRRPLALAIIQQRVVGPAFVTKGVGEKPGHSRSAFRWSNTSGTRVDAWRRDRQSLPSSSARCRRR